MNNSDKITQEKLFNLGFRKHKNGNVWLDLHTHYIELLESNGYFYPTLAEYPEFSSTPEQRVGVNRINTMKELNILISIISETE
jgi:hypothetical protein